MPDSLVDYSPVLEETAEVPEVVQRRRPMYEEPMQSGVRPPLQAFPMNDCQAECASAPLSAQGWVAFNKHKLQEIFEVTFSEMTAEATQPVNDSPTATSEAESDQQDNEDDEKENAVGQCSPSASAQRPCSPTSEAPSLPSSSSSSAKTSEEHSKKRKRGSSFTSSASSPALTDLCDSAECTSSPVTAAESPKPSNAGRKGSWQNEDAKGNSPSSEAKGVSEHWVALNKTVVLDMFDSAIEHSLQETTAQVTPAEALDLSTRPPRPDQQEEEEEVEEVVALASPVEKKGAKRRRGGAAVVGKGKQRKEAANKVAKPPRKKSSKGVGGRTMQRQRKACGSAAAAAAAAASMSTAIDAVQNAVDDPASPASRMASVVRVRSARSSSPMQGNERTCPPSEQCTADTKGQRTSIDRSPLASGDEGVSGCASPGPRGHVDSKRSPKHGWVALSKADVHTIVDSVVTSVILRGDGDDQPPAPPSNAPRSHHPRRVSFASVDQLAKGSPPDSPVASCHSSDDGSHLHRPPFKWKSNMMMRANASSPGEEPVSPSLSE